VSAAVRNNEQQGAGTAVRSLLGALALLLASTLAYAVVPSAPTNLVATAVSTTQINLSWTDTSNNETSFKIERKTGSGGTYSQIATTGANVATFNNTGRTAGTTYFYRVRASNASGNSAYTNEASATTPVPDKTAPTAPSSLTASAASSSQINLSWTASTDNVGVSGYRVERCQGTSCTNFAQIGTPTVTSFSDTGRTAATAYRYRVRATDAAGNLSAYSNIAAATTPAADTTAPTAPSGLTATALSSSQINLAWTASTDNVGVTGYRMERCQGAACTTFVQIATPTATSFSDAGLSPSTSYSYRVRAADAAGNLSAYSNIASVTTQAPPDTTAPGAPAGLTATALSSSQINLAWSAPTDNVGVTGYQVDRCQGVGCSAFLQVATPTATSFSDAGLNPSTSYSYRVRATDAAGNLSANSNVASATTQAPPDITPPTAPTGLTALAAGTTQVNLAWSASTDNVAVTGYSVERCQGAGCASFAQIATPTGTSFGDTGLTAGTSYSYRVRATDAAGNLSAYSNVASISTASAQVQMYYIVPDHLNTPRLIADQNQTTVWRWDQGEPFGNDVPNNNPSGAGAFDFPLRFPGQYFDRETNLAYNVMRDYDPAIGRYVESDPIGLAGGINTYAYVLQNPLGNTDPTGRLTLGGVIAGVGAIVTAATVWKAYKTYRDCVDNKQSAYLACQRKTEAEVEKYIKGMPANVSQAMAEEKEAYRELLDCAIDLGKALTDLYSGIVRRIPGLTQ
jgi:RHS repeat-associated protein